MTHRCECHDRRIDLIVVLTDWEGSVFLDQALDPPGASW
jgi:hypothetical protein